jgi:phage-related tail fiber protein
LANGAAVDIVRGSLFIDGYAATPNEAVNIAVDVDGQYARTVRYGVEEKPILTALSDGENAEVSRFAAMVPAWALVNGQRRVNVTVETESGVHAATNFSIIVDRADAGEGAVPRQKVPLAELQLAGRILSGLGWMR